MIIDAAFTISIADITIRHAADCRAARHDFIIIRYSLSLFQAFD
jgi:hypothetical protein